jgi:hypothetical protein
VILNTLQTYCDLLLHVYHYRHSFSSQNNFNLSPDRKHIFGLVWGMCLHPLHSLIFSFSSHKQNAGFITCYSYHIFERLIIPFLVSLWKVIRCNDMRFVCVCGYVWSPSCTKLVTAERVIIPLRRLRGIFGSVRESFEIVKRPVSCRTRSILTTHSRTLRSPP